METMLDTVIILLLLVAALVLSRSIAVMRRKRHHAVFDKARWVGANMHWQGYSCEEIKRELLIRGYSRTVAKDVVEAVVYLSLAEKRQKEIADRYHAGDKKGYYRLLGVAPQASPEEIKHAYREMAKKHHPDTSQASGELFKKITEAYTTLRNADSRGKYDAL